MTEKGFRHFHLPVQAGDYISNREIYNRYQFWLYALKSAHERLQDCLEEIDSFSEELESVRLAAPESALCVQAKSDLQELRNAFSAEVKTAVAVTTQNALVQAEFDPQSLAYKVWTYSPAEPSSLKLFYHEIKRRHPLRCQFGVHLDSLLHLNKEFSQQTDEEVQLEGTVQAQQAEIQRLNTALEEAQREVEGLKAELARQREEGGQYRDLKEEVAKLRKELKVKEEVKRKKEPSPPSAQRPKPTGIPSYKTPQPGFVIISYCNNVRCAAYNDAFYVNKGFVENLACAREFCEIECPLCHEHCEEVLDCGFYMARWTMDGMKQDGVHQKRSHVTRDDNVYLLPDISQGCWRYINVTAESTS